jgi:hypothetical protein
LLPQILGVFGGDKLGGFGIGVREKKTVALFPTSALA